MPVVKSGVTGTVLMEMSTPVQEPMILPQLTTTWVKSRPSPKPVSEVTPAKVGAVAAGVAHLTDGEVLSR